MNCPVCNSKLKTTNSRQTASGSATWRRKHCSNCELTITSKESLELSQIIKIDKMPYSRSKLTAQIAKVSSKSSEEDISDIVNTIEIRLLKLIRHKHSITQEIFSSEISKVLEKLDKPASLRYQAEHGES